MKNNKSSGSGGIPVELYKFSPNVVLEILTVIFNKYVKGEEIPSEWKTTNISSKNKNGKKHDCTNCRGTSDYMTEYYKIGKKINLKTGRNKVASDQVNHV